MRQFKGGQSNPTYQLETPGALYVMRAKPGPAAKLLPSAHAIEREFRVMQALAATDVPVARMHLLCEDEGVIGRAFYVMAHVHWRGGAGAAGNSVRGRVRAALSGAGQRGCSGGWTHEALMADWDYYLAYNMFRIAAILQGIARRVVDGTASSAQARQAGAGAHPMAALAWKHALKAGARPV